jgi:hypothetical protein
MYLLKGDRMERALQEVRTDGRAPHEPLHKGDRLASTADTFSQRWHEVPPDAPVTVPPGPSWPAGLPALSALPALPAPAPSAAVHAQEPSHEPSHHRVRERSHDRHDRHELCAAHGMRRQDYTRPNGWRAWRCVH